jgi:23S rRNA (guanine745-N1)-methyltransferase
MLACPRCRGSLKEAGRALRCARGHSFDVARQGYVALEGRARGDTAAMVAAREAFLGAGHYAPIAAALVEAAPAAHTIVDLGAGTGYYLAALLDAQPEARGVALDASRPALRRAARAHSRIVAVACDIWHGLPLEDGAADVIVNVFAPRNVAEMRRVLAPGGAIVVVTPTPRHLHELALLDVHPGKRARLHAALSPPVRRELVEFELALERHDVEALVAMGPSAHHGLRRRRAARVTASVVIETYRG